MIPFFFGDGLFGAYHPPQITSSSKVGVVMLYPAFGEYIQQHRLFYLMGEKLAEQGIPTLRFDYFGTGDSQGDLVAASLERWIQDTQHAVEELRRRSSIRGICLIGSRLGAWIACKQASEDPSIESVVLWNPIPDGETYLESMEKLHAMQLETYTKQANSTDSPKELLGFSVPRSLYKEIGQTVLTECRLYPDQRILVKSSAEEELGLHRVFDSTYLRVTFDVETFPTGWLSPLDGIYDILVPPNLLQSTITWITFENNRI